MQHNEGTGDVANVKDPGKGFKIDGPTTTGTLIIMADDEGNIIHGTTIKEYEDFVKSMKVYPEKNAIIYPALGLSGESGEVAEKVKKWLRGDSNGELDKAALAKELGDIMWYITSMATDLGFTLQQVVDMNILKLRNRTLRGTRKGNGDDR